MPTCADRRRLPVSAFLAALAAFVLAACGGSDGNIDGPPQATPAPAAPVARLEILSDSAWLPGNGHTRQLAAQAYDAAGHPVSAAISWTSSRASHVAVDASGRLTSQVSAGSAQITAQAGGVVSAPLLAYVATPAAGVVLVDDASIVGQPVETDPAATPSLANTYQVTLSGIAPPAVGTLLLGRGDKSLAGKVTAVTTTGAQTVATLQLVPLPELFAELEIEEILDLSRAEVMVPPEVEAAFNVNRNDNTWTFAPKAATTTSRARPQAITGTHARDILPFRSCEVGLEGYDELSSLPIGLEPPTFSITLSPRLDVRYDRRSGLTRFVVSAEPRVTIGATLQASVPIKGALECSLQLLALRLPIGGPLAFFIGGMVPVGVGFELEAEATLATFKIGAQSEIGTKMSAGWNCPGPTCEFVRSIEDSTATLTPVFDAPDPIADARLESKLNLFGYLEAELGNPFLRSLRFKAFEERIGATFNGNFAPPVAQVLDAAYAADYTLSAKGEAKLGTGIDDIVTLFGLGSLTSIELDIERELARSPTALKVEADRATFVVGDTINVKVTLDPATLNFLGIYNVESVQLRRSIGGTLTAVLGTQTASTGQQVFDFNVVAPHAGDVSEWSAFVTTRLLPFELASLEVRRAAVSGLEVLMLWGGTAAVAQCSAGAYEIGGTRPRAMESRDDKAEGEANPATCFAQAWDAKAEGWAVSSASGPTQDRFATPTPVTSLSSIASAAASGTSTPDIYIETPPHIRRASGSGYGAFGGEWLLLVQGQAVTMTITGTLSGYTRFAASWAPSSSDVGVAGSYVRDPVRGETGTMSHSVRLEPGQQVHIRYTGQAGAGAPGAPPDPGGVPQMGPSATASFSVVFTP
jgi:hypothetical protein